MSRILALRAKDTFTISEGSFTKDNIYIVHSILWEADHRNAGVCVPNDAGHITPVIVLSMQDPHFELLYTLNE